MRASVGNIFSVTCRVPQLRASATLALCLVPMLLSGQELAVNEVAFATAERRVLMRLLAEPDDGPTPAIVPLHGGSSSLAQHHLYDSYATVLAAHGYPVDAVLSYDAADARHAHARPLGKMGNLSAAPPQLHPHGESAYRRRGTATEHRCAPHRLTRLFQRRVSRGGRRRIRPPDGRCRGGVRGHAVGLARPHRAPAAHVDPPWGGGCRGPRRRRIGAADLARWAA